MHLRLPFVFGVFLLLSPVAALASCGSSTCPIDTLSAERGGKGWVRIGYDFEYIDQDQPRIGRNKASVGELRGHHDEIYTVNRVHRLNGSIGITDRLSADVLLPYVSRSHMHVHHHHGTDIYDAWDFSGVGDLVAMMRYAVFQPTQSNRPTVYGILGGKFPTGNHNKMNHDNEAAEIGIQPGSGSYDLIVGGSTLQRFSAPMVTGGYGTMPLFFTTTYQRNTRGVDDYRIGHVLLVTAGTSYPVTSVVAVATQLNLKVKAKDLRGQTSEEVHKTGGEFLYFSPGLEFRLGSHWLASTVVQLPIYQRVNQIQLVSNYNLLSSLSYRFQL